MERSKKVGKQTHPKITPTQQLLLQRYIKSLSREDKNAFLSKIIQRETDIGQRHPTVFFNDKGQRVISLKNMREETLLHLFRKEKFEGEPKTEKLKLFEKLMLARIVDNSDLDKPDERVIRRVKSMCPKCFIDSNLDVDTFFLFLDSITYSNYIEILAQETSKNMDQAIQEMKDALARMAGKIPIVDMPSVVTVGKLSDHELDPLRIYVHRMAIELEELFRKQQQQQLAHIFANIYHLEIDPKEKKQVFDAALQLYGDTNNNNLMKEMIPKYERLESSIRDKSKERIESAWRNVLQSLLNILKRSEEEEEYSDDTGGSIEEEEVIPFKEWEEEDVLHLPLELEPSPEQEKKPVSHREQKKEEDILKRRKKDKPARISLMVERPLLKERQQKPLPDQRKSFTFPKKTDVTKKRERFVEKKVQEPVESFKKPSTSWEDKNKQLQESFNVFHDEERLKKQATSSAVFEDLVDSAIEYIKIIYDHFKSWEELCPALKNFIGYAKLDDKSKKQFDLFLPSLKKHYTKKK